MISQLVERALNRACQRIDTLSHAQRSSAWVSALAEELRACSEHCAPARRVVSFCRADGGNRAEFQTNELLFDILVAETRSLPSARGKDIQALSRALWVVESELKRTDSRDVLLDLNKLVVAKAVNKLLVISGSTPLVSWTKEVMAALLDPRECNVFLVTIPHPEEWCEPLNKSAEVYQLLPDARWLTPPSSRQPSAAAHIER